jgi:hypothetical protein
MTYADPENKRTGVKHTSIHPFATMPMNKEWILNIIFYQEKEFTSSRCQY